MRRGTSQNRVTSVKLKPETFMAGTTMSNASSPEARIGRRKRFHIVQQFDDALIEAEIPQAPGNAPPFSIRKVPSRVMPVMIFS